MARIRTIKPEFFTSEDIVSVSPLARLFYIALWCEADREGRLEWKPGTFKLRYLPGDNVTVEQLTDELTNRGLLRIYEASGKRYAAIPTFSKHQVINNREADSALPPPSDASSRVKAASSRAKAEGKGKEGKEGKEGTEHASSPDAFTQFWDAWPKNERKQDKAKCAEKFKAHDLASVLPAILADIETKKKTEKWQKGFIEAPEVYINNRRWEDGAGPGQPDLQPVNTAADETAAQLSLLAAHKAQATPPPANLRALIGGAIKRVEAA